MSDNTLERAVQAAAEALNSSWIADVDNDTLAHIAVEAAAPILIGGAVLAVDNLRERAERAEAEVKKLRTEYDTVQKEARRLLGESLRIPVLEAEVEWLRAHREWDDRTFQAGVAKLKAAEAEVERLRAQACLPTIQAMTLELQDERALADRLVAALRLLRTEGDHRAYEADIALAAYDEARR